MPRRGVAGRERGVQLRRGGRDAEAVRSDQAHPVPAADRQQVSAAAAEARGDHDERVHAAATAGRGDAGTSDGGTAMTATSTPSGRSAAEARQVRPSIEWPRGFTA